ncbi:CopG family transcriptional regulator [Rhizobium calliandrae]|uniref:CopG family transcriptional regulator n=1 Tax=Rhizobium calliandrae TaxID=1312182 RepID=A0ABT7KMF1_9HYPH|nr:CopG family transcriptional regulator [Rhizobium calliandrae]MDL2409795.1 CopG family transcriptional regulator [Rhizobium calliandrae]
MTTRDHGAVLEDAADCIGDMSLADLPIILRRAALMLRNAGSVPIDEQVEEAIDSIADELGKTRNDVIRYIIKECLETNVYLPVQVLDDDGDVEGSAWERPDGDRG